MTTKQILQTYWKTTAGYAGKISCRKTKENDKNIYYAVETEGNRFEAMIYKSYPDLVFYHEEGCEKSWNATNGIPCVVFNGKPYNIFM